MSQPIQRVIVIGASGNVGKPILTALLSDGSFDVSVLSRESSSATFPDLVRVKRTDYSYESLLKAFEGQNAVVSAVTTFSTHQQHQIIDAAEAAGVSRFIPSDFGFDTADDNVVELIPPAMGKKDTVKYLKSKENNAKGTMTSMTWTTISCGGFFDWAFQTPGLMGWNLPARKAIIFDGGETRLEFTNLAQVGRAVTAVLKPENYEATKNTYVYVNSFTVTQNCVLSCLEKITEAKFEITPADSQELARSGLAKWNAEPDSEQVLEEGRYPAGAMDLITAGLNGYGGFNCFSQRKGLWNERLGLPKEDLEETLRRVVEGVLLNINKRR
jgi:hypothetical protein